MARTVKTRHGRVLTEADVARLAARAEEGFDLAGWRPRRGRPSLSEPGKGHSPRVAVRVSDDLHRRVTARAAAEGKSMSQVVRDLLDGYAAGRKVAARSARRARSQ